MTDHRGYLDVTTDGYIHATHVIDVRDPSAPEIIRTLITRTAPTGVAADGAALYVATGAGA